MRTHIRARRYALRIKPSDGSVWLTIPTGGNLNNARQFAISKIEWIRAQKAKMVLPEGPFAFGDEVEIWGRSVQIVAAKGRRAVFDGTQLALPGSTDQLGTRLKAFLKEQARSALVPASDNFATELGRSFGRVSFRDTSTRWGSCTSKGDLMYSLRLAMTPPEVARYVAAHEVCHLVEMNHSARFWALVEKICPDYRTQRKWLKQNGARLQAVPLR